VSLGQRTFGAPERIKASMRGDSNVMSEPVLFSAAFKEKFIKNAKLLNRIVT
jgi:hypothetical protein